MYLSPSTHVSNDHTRHVHLESFRLQIVYSPIYFAGYPLAIHDVVQGCMVARYPIAIHDVVQGCMVARYPLATHDVVQGCMVARYPLATHDVV